MLTNLNETSAELREPVAEVAESAVERLCRAIALRDYAFVAADRTRELLAAVHEGGLADWVRFRDSWNHLHQDGHMADGGTYRKRRHATLSALPSSRCLQVQPHQPHYQTVNYNPLNGGVARHFEPIESDILRGPTLQAVLTLGCELFGRLSPYSPWHIEVHQFRIEAGAGQPGKPTPEGIHRDGVSFVMMLMVRRDNLVNGATSIYDLDRHRLDEVTLQQPFDLAVVNDERVFHGVTPIVQLDVDREAIRDVLVVTFRRKA